ncbi:hypothetical protein V9K67_17185 [Paraflavisolibacter sp. H34]|uniref:hypothetical protein n=1 Tax=Huijunlia imazamoxiresistens TaxID=3127457 RepID=UPI00301ABDAF
MEVKRQDDTRNRPEGERTLNAPFVPIDLPQFIEQIRNEKNWKERDHTAITVFKNRLLTVVLVAMHPGAEIHTQRPEHLWNVQVLEGSVRLAVNGDEVRLLNGGMAVVNAGIKYSLQATEESLLLLTVAGEEAEGDNPNEA